MNDDITIRINLWLEQGGAMYFGMGRYLLLKEVQAHGSLKKAAQTMNMSYRAAWGKLKKTEETIGTKLIEKQGSNRSGYQLTELGQKLLTGYETWLAEVEEYALKSAAKHFAGDLCSFE